MEENLLTVKDAASVTGQSDKKIYKAVQDHQLHRYGEKQIMVQSDEVKSWADSINQSTLVASPYDNIALYYDESLKLIEAIHNPNNIAKVGRYITDEKYAVSNIGRVFNLTRNLTLSASPAAHGYLQVTLGTGGGAVHERVHVLVAMFWCQNGKRKPEVHHIDGNKVNNNATNLVWVTEEEHTKAERMLKIATENKDYKAYQRYIQRIKKDNQWKEEYRCITEEDATSVVFYWVTEKFFSDYISGKRGLDRIDAPEILMEFHCCKVGGTIRK